MSGEQMSPKVTAVILNTNRKEDTLACLESLSIQERPIDRILVLDNQSTDGSAQAIADRYPQVRVLDLAANKGYAGNNNVGISAALEEGADWLLILNEDVVLHPKAAGELLTAAISLPEVGFVGPMVYHFDEPEIIQSAGGMMTKNWLSAHRGQNQADQGQFARVEPVAWVSGCAFLVRRELIEDLGAIDERFFYYWEETEWCLRARAHGWIVLFVPSAKVWHKGVQRNYKPSTNTTYYWTRNWLLLLAKHHAPIRAWLFAGAWMFRNLLSWSLRPTWQSRQGHRGALLSGVLDFVRHRWGMRPIHGVDRPPVGNGS